jgi:hypothetical protein
MLFGEFFGAERFTLVSAGVSSPKVNELFNKNDTLFDKRVEA